MSVAGTAGVSPELALDGVWVAYWRKGGLSGRERYWVLKDISFDVEAGETLGIIGKNGSGKSVLMRLLAGIIRPNRGTLRRCAGRASLLSLQLGFVPHLTGRENAYMSGMLLGLTRAEVRQNIDAIVEFSELAEFFDQPLATYSSGMRARLGFSVALTADPEILLIDEVWGVGDAGFREKSATLMRQRAVSEKTVVIVSHNTDLLQRLCNRVVWIHGGRIKAVGVPGDVVKRYEQSVG